MQYKSEGRARGVWWEYMNFVHTNCYSIINEQCSKRAHEKLNLDFEVTKQCVKDSFSSADWGNEKTNNTLIDSEIDYWK